MEKWMEYVWANDDEDLAPLSLSLSFCLSHSLIFSLLLLLFNLSLLLCLDASLIPFLTLLIKRLL